MLSIKFVGATLFIPLISSTTVLSIKCQCRKLHDPTVNRGYPAKRALSAMHKYGGGPFWQDTIEIQLCLQRKRRHNSLIERTVLSSPIQIWPLAALRSEGSEVRYQTQLKWRGGCATKMLRTEVTELLNGSNKSTRMLWIGRKLRSFWHVCYIIFCHSLHIHFRKTGNLFSLLFCSLWWVQIFEYVLACRWYSFVCTLHRQIMIIVQTYLKTLNL